MLVGVYVVFQ